MGLARFPRRQRSPALASSGATRFIGAFVVSAIVTPSIDPVTQSLVAGPIIVLYGIGIVLAWLVPATASQGLSPSA